MTYNQNDLFWDFPGGPVAKALWSLRKGPELIPGQGTRSHMTQLKPPQAATKIEDLCASTKAQHI